MSASSTERFISSKFVICLCALTCVFAWSGFAGLAVSQETPSKEISEQERLRGSVTAQRAWWDLKHYSLAVKVDPENRSIEGSNSIRFEVIAEPKQMQVDLQPPLEITSARLKDKELAYTRNGNVYLLDLPAGLVLGTTHEVQIEYSGNPVVSKRPPWSGGFTWNTDGNGKHFIATSCQGDGASLWWPCKDHGYDEPDEGVDLLLTVPDDLSAVGNGRLVETLADAGEQTKTFHWRVTQPINNYSINANIGDYVHFEDTFEGELGDLDIQYWVLRDNLELARTHFKEAPRTLAAFEHWFGPYPFYEDGYKLVEVPYLGMEHQSSVTYGNGFKNGYRGTDLSGTGVGMKFDFIVVHESGHEWFGNNISMKDAADMWIHESFTNYSENLFVEYHFTRQEAEDYVIGCRKRVRNDSPIIGTYNANRSGSGDMYYKGGNMLHTLRYLVNDTNKWRSILRGLNEEFRHKTVTTEQVEDYLAEQTGLELDAFFEQYLRANRLPNLEYQIDGAKLSCRYVDVVDGFEMPLQVRINQEVVTLKPSAEMQHLEFEKPIESFEIDRNFFIDSREVEMKTD
ncbi:MAG: M1 family metallopeptidase [Pirellulaceae bacterium]